MRRACAVMLLLGAGLLSGCAASEPAQSDGVDLPKEASADQIAAVQDGQVTDEEYTAGYRRFVACLRDLGYDVEEYGRPSTVYEAGVEESAMDSGAYDDCYRREFWSIDILWQEANPPWTEFGPVLQGCLEDAGLPTDGNEEELKQRMVDNGLDVYTCLGFPPHPGS